jgi:hypothetical protein
MEVEVGVEVDDRLVEVEDSILVEVEEVDDRLVEVEDSILEEVVAAHRYIVGNR